MVNWYKKIRLKDKDRHKNIVGCYSKIIKWLDSGKNLNWKYYDQKILLSW